MEIPCFSIAHGKFQWEKTSNSTGNRDRSQDETGWSTQLEAHELQNHGDLSKWSIPPKKHGFCWFMISMIQQVSTKFLGIILVGGWPTPLKSHGITGFNQFPAPCFAHGIIPHGQSQSFHSSASSRPGMRRFRRRRIAWFPTMGYRVPPLIVGNPIYKWMSCWGTLMDWKPPYV